LCEIYIGEARKRNREGVVLPVPQVKKGKWSKERERTKSGRWRKKRSDADQPRHKHSNLKYIVAAIGVVIVVIVVLYLLFPSFFSQLLRLPST